MHRITKSSVRVQEVWLSSPPLSSNAPNAENAPAMTPRGPRPLIVSIFCLLKRLSLRFVLQNTLEDCSVN